MNTADEARAEAFAEAERRWPDPFVGRLATIEDFAAGAEWQASRKVEAPADLAQIIEEHAYDGGSGGMMNGQFEEMCAQIASAVLAAGYRKVEAAPSDTDRLPTHFVRRRDQSTPCWCPATADHSVADTITDTDLRARAAETIFNHNAEAIGSAVRFSTASDRMKKTAYEYADALLPLLSRTSQPVQVEVTDREAVRKVIAERASILNDHQADVLTDAILAALGGGE